MKRLSFLISALLLVLNATAGDERVLMTVNGEPVTVSEFMYIYQKNYQSSSQEQTSIDECLDRFIKFKLKVAEAASQGVDTTEAFRKELSGYRSQATPKYLQDDEALDSLIQMSYNRIAHPRRAAHIVIECHTGSDSATEALALAKIDSARQRVTTGIPQRVKKGKKWITVQQKEDFATVANAVSMDPGAQNNGGEIGWLQIFRYVYAFEDAVYNTPVGEVTPIFRSPFGYHIALVEGERDYEEVHAAHIMKMVPRGNVEKAAQAAKDIDSLYQLVLAGSEFEQVAEKNSDDRGSARKKGDLGWFGRGMMVQPFEDTVFTMTPGTISQPFLSRFGWHIVKLYDKRGILPLDSMRQDIQKKVIRDERYQEAKKSFLRKTRSEYNLPAEMSDADVMKYADAHLEEKHEDLRHLIQEYHDGIMLFDVSLREVWDKASQDTIGLTKFFKANKANYTWSAPKYKGYVIYAKNEVVANSAKQICRSANPDSIMSYLNQRINLDSVTYVKVEHGLWSKGQNAAVDEYGFKDKTATVTPDEKFPIIVTIGKVLKAPEEYMDERGKVTTDYQDLLETQWVEQLRAKYPVVVNQDVFESLKKQ